MILPDVNVLVYAFRPEGEYHALCRDWLKDLVSGDTRFAISPLTLAALVRVSTNRRIYKTPSTLEEAFAFADNLRSQPHGQIVEPGERHWPIFRRLCIETGTTGPRTTDAWFAALAIEWGCTWITIDRDFARFPGLAWRRPG